MTKIKHIMLDLETWGTEPGDDIRSIGACVFDPIAGDVSIPCQTCKGGTVHGNVNDGGDCSDCMNTRMQSGYGDTFYIACDNPLPDWYVGLSPDTNRKYMLRRDPRTVQWWSEQTKEAQAAFANPVDLKEALQRFDSWLGGLFNYEVILSKTDCINVWSHGSHFDSPILAAAYRACDLEYPLHYRAPRDTRTLFDAAGIDNHSAWLAERPGPLGIHHHALDDAICQAKAVCGAYQRMQQVRDGSRTWLPL